MANPPFKLTTSSPHAPSSIHSTSIDTLINDIYTRPDKTIEMLCHPPYGSERYTCFKHFGLKVFFDSYERRGAELARDDIEPFRDTSEQDRRFILEYWQSGEQRAYEVKRQHVLQAKAGFMAEEEVGELERSGEAACRFFKAGREVCEVVMEEAFRKSEVQLQLDEVAPRREDVARQEARNKAKDTKRRKSFMEKMLGYAYREDVAVDDEDRDEIGFGDPFTDLSDSEAGSVLGDWEKA